MQHRLTDIMPLTEFKAKSAAMIEKLRGSPHPLVLTQNGRAALVVMSPAAFDALQQEEHVRAKIAAGLADIEAGRVVEDDQMWAELEAHMDATEQRAP